MKRHRLADAKTTFRNCLGYNCGTNIDTEGIEFANMQPHLTYIDKVFSFNEDTSCPILFDLNTALYGDDFQIKLFLDGCDCSDVPCTLTRDAVFEIDKTFVAVEYFNTRPPGNIIAPQVTLNGFPVDAVSYSNGQYTAKTANVLSRVQRDQCLDEGLPTKTFFLIRNAGPWDFRATYVLEGTVNTGGRLCRFRAEITNIPGSANTSVPPGYLSNFAIRDLSLPCAINGIAPDINFQFNARINLVNPRLVVNCETCRPTIPPIGPGTQEDTQFSPPFPCCPCPPCPPVVNPTSCTVSLVTSLAIEPEVHVETVRKTLFCLNACEGLQPCQGSVIATEIEEDEEECIIGGVDRPDCCCNPHKFKHSRDCDECEDYDCCDDSDDDDFCDDSKERIREILKRKSRCMESEECVDDSDDDDCCCSCSDQTGRLRERIRKHEEKGRSEVSGRMKKKCKTAFQIQGSSSCGWNGCSW